MTDVAYIDDNKDCLEIVQMGMADMGIAIDIYDDPIQFYNMQKEYKVVISDYEMPGLNGQDFITLLKDKYPKIKTVIYSGIVDTMPKKDMRIDSFLLKPSEFESLHKVLKFLLFAYDKENKETA